MCTYYMVPLLNETVTMGASHKDVTTIPFSMATPGCQGKHSKYNQGHSGLCNQRKEASILLY